MLSHCCLGSTVFTYLNYSNPCMETCTKVESTTTLCMHTDTITVDPFLNKFSAITRKKLAHKVYNYVSSERRNFCIYSKDNLIQSVHSNVCYTHCTHLRHLLLLYLFFCFLMVISIVHWK